MADKLHTFVRMLKKRTEEGKINWEQTVEDGAYLAAFPDYTVTLSFQNSGRYDEPDQYSFSIRNKEGTVIEEMDAQGLASSEYEDAWTDLREIYRLARRRAMGLDQALDSMLGVLGVDLDPVPKPRKKLEDFNQGITDDDVPF